MQQDNMGDTEPVNPLYDMNSAPEVQKGDLMMSSGSSNPMYDFLSSEGTNGHADSNDLLGLDSSNQVNGSIEKDTNANQSEDFDGLNQNGGETIEDFDPFGGTSETAPVVDEFSSKNEAIEDFEQESGSGEQEGGSSTSGELLVDSDVSNTRLVPEEDLQGETAEPQESEDLLGGAMEPQVTEEKGMDDPVEEAVEKEEQLLVEAKELYEEEPPKTENGDQSESLMDQEKPESEEGLGEFTQSEETTEQNNAPEEDQGIVDIQQEEPVEVQQIEDSVPPPEPQPEEKLEEPAAVEEISQPEVQGWWGIFTNEAGIFIFDMNMVFFKIPHVFFIKCEHFLRLFRSLSGLKLNG